MIPRVNRRLLNLLLLSLLLVSVEMAGRCSSAQPPGGKITQTLEGIVAPHYRYGAWALSPDGKTLALPRGERGIELWDLTTGKPTMLPNLRGKEGGAGSVAYSKSGRALAASHGHGITIWAIPERKESVQIRRERGVLNMVFTDADRTLLAEDLVRSDDSSSPLKYKSVIVQWDVSSGKRLSNVDFGTHHFKAISPNGRYGVIDNWRKDGMGVYDLTTGAKILGLPSVGDFIFSDDGSTIVHYTTNLLSVTEIPSGKQLKRFVAKPPVREGNSVVLSLSSKAKLLAVGGRLEDRLASVISLESGDVLGTVECGPPLTICEKLQISLDGRTLVTGTHGANTKDQPVEPWLKIWRLPENW